MAPKFQGVYTALITPFDEREQVDEQSLEGLVEFNIENGISGIAPCGTTGESPTLSHNEHDRVIELVVAYANKRVPIIAGTGSNSTREAIRLTQNAEDTGADAALLITPYYNKPTQEGLYRHFKAIADNTALPCILYNIPGRTAVNLEIPTLLRLIESCQNIIGIKEASGKIDQIKETIKQTSNFQGFSVLSGDDNLTLEIIKAGGQGVISAASNLIPQAMSELVAVALHRNYEKAEKMNSVLTPLFKAEFVETNPIPIKYMLSKQGRCKEVYRLPLCEMSPEHKTGVDKVLKEMHLIS